MVNLFTVLSRIEGVKVSFTREMDFMCVPRRKVNLWAQEIVGIDLSTAEWKLLLN